jgi:predicted RNA methylase
MIDNQFYPTPPALAEKAWKLFTNRNYQSLLEPSAGRGDLIDHRKGRLPYHVDCIESDADNIAILKEKGYRVIDTDFLTFDTRKNYDRVLLNPPFNRGVTHTLKAWEIVKNGQIVSIVNAETVKNPYSKDRQFLVSLIEECGSVEFIEEAFLSPDAQRITTVEIALIHLVKEVAEDESLFSIKDMGLKDDDKRTDATEETLFHKELAIPKSSISNSVIAFNNAVEAAELSIKASAKASYYKSLITSTRISKQSNRDATRNFNEEYEELKRCAWQTVITATEFTSRFSRSVVKRLEEDLESIKHLQFNERNIYGLLEGLLLNKKQLDNQMLLDTFDSITAYHSGNRFIYRGYAQNGWKSNDKHRSRAFRMKHTQFILPARSGTDGSSRFGYEGKRLLADFDKTFALLDGKIKPENSLENMFSDTETFSALLQGERLNASYFSCRYYPGIDSIHFFPTKKGQELVDRFNRVVGRLRNWLPDEETVSPVFWEQFEKAEKVTKKLEEDPEYIRLRDYDFYHNEMRGVNFEKLHSSACEKLNIPIFNRLEEQSAEQMALPLAC